MIQAICDEDPPRPRSGMSENFKRFISACLKKNPSERASTADLLDSAFVSAYKSQASYINSSSFDSKVSEQISTPRNSKQLDIKSPLSSHVTSSVAMRRKSHTDPHDEEKPKGYIKNIPSLSSFHSSIDAIRLDHLERILDRLNESLKTEDNVFTKPEMNSIKKKNLETSVNVDDVEDTLGSSISSFASFFKLPNDRAIKIPNLFGPGAAKWQHLANQLHIPISLVRIAAKAKLHLSSHGPLHPDD